jgi:tetratricopeptide (TPR) repeat protein
MRKRHTKPLENDPRRVAVPTLNGYSFQIWHSIHRWVTLKHGEVLFLEGAEDIDILGPGGAETIQVGETRASGPITLGSPKVLAAIAHYWEHQEKNSELILFLRFLTTSERTQERADPFDGMRGLDYWDSARRAGVDISPLRSFLQSQRLLPVDLREFLRTSSDAELRERLIKRIEWDTGNKVQTFIEGLINKEVISYGYRVYNLAPAESLKVVSHLLRRAWETACDKDDRYLDFPDFMQIFEEVLTERVSRPELIQLRRAALLLAEPASLSTNLLGFNATIDLLDAPLLERAAKRVELVSLLLDRLNKNGFLILKGSTGTGKSTLAKLITEADATSWRRLSLRGVEPEQIRDRLFYLAQFSAKEAASDYIIDDLNFDKQVLAYEEILAEVLYVVTSHGGRLIITTQGDLPSRVSLQLGLTADCIFNVPLFTVQEVAQLVFNHGCHDASVGATWSRTIFWRTSGHPQLVHARVKKLAANGWPAAEPIDITETEDIENVRREARIQLREQLPSRDARTLAYRLSVLSGPFRRVQALFLGTQGVPIGTPGEAFDLLIGPWVERLNESYYQLSPLLSGAASEVFADLEVTGLHKAAAESYLTEKSLGLFELNGALIHGLIGKAAQPIAAVVIACNGVDPANWPAVGRALYILAYLGESKLEPLFPTDPLLSLMLRQVQFKVAAEVDASERGVRVAEEWEKELTAFDDVQQPYPARLFMELLYLSSIVIETKVPLPLNRVVRAMAAIRSTSNALGSFISQHPMPNRKDAPDFAQSLSVERMLPLTITRCKNGDDVRDFLVTLSEQQPEVAEEVWDQFRKDETLAAFLIDRAWLHEEKKPSPDWGRCLEMLEMVARVGLSAKVDSVVAYAYRAKAIVEEEYLKNTERAEVAISEGEEKLGHAHRLLADYRAKILYFDEQWDEALQIWEPLLEEDARCPDPDNSLSYREAEICAAKLGRWEASAEIALKGERAARVSYPSVIKAVEFKADYAFACWMAGRRKDSIESFAQVLEALDGLPSPGTDLLTHALQLRVGYTMAWLWEMVKRSEVRPQPDAAFFSNPSIKEETRDHPSPTRIYMWQSLAEVEYALNAGNYVFNKLAEKTTKPGVQTTGVLFSILRLKHDFCIGALNNLIAHFRDLTEASKRPMVDESKEEDLSDVEELSGIIDAASNRSAVLEQLKSLLFAAIVKVVGTTELTTALLTIWRSDLQRDGFLDEEIQVWLAFIERSEKMAPYDLVKVFKNGSATAEERLSAALLLSITDDLKPEDKFYANVLLVTTNYHALWREETGPVIESSVTRRWSLIAREQPFALRNPGFNVSAILERCNDLSSAGLQKAARILLAARSAVRIGVPDVVLQQLQDLAG